MAQNGLKNLSAFRVAEKNIQVSIGLARWCTYALLLCWSLILLQSWISFSLMGRYLLLGLFLFLLLLLWYRYVQRTLVSRLFRPGHPSINSIALRLGRTYPHLQDRLANALQISAMPEEEKKNLSPALIAAVEKNLTALFDQLDLSHHLDWAPVKTWCRRLSLLGGITVAVGAFFYQPLSIGLDRIFHPHRDLTSPQAVTFSVKPGNATLLRGEPLVIRAWTTTKLSQDLGIEIDRYGRKELLPMTRGVNDTFFYTIPTLRDSLRYQIRYQRAVSNTYLIRVVHLPMIRTLQLRVLPPAYSGADAYLLEENIGDVSALKGSKIEWRAESNKSLAEAHLLFASQRTQPLVIKDRQLTTSFSLITEDSYFAELKDHQGFTSENAIHYRLNPMLDHFPLVRLLSPAGDINLHEDMQLPLLIQAQDDYGISEISLAFQVIGEGEAPIDSTRFTKIPLPITGSRRTVFNLAYNWDLSSPPLLPTEVLLYYIEVRDNDTVSGPKSSRTGFYRARFPSIYELYEEVSKSQDEAIAQMEQGYEKSLELKTKLEELALQLKRADELSWQKKQEVADMMKQKEALQQSLQEIAEHLDEMVEKMEDNQLLSRETLQKYEELQQLYREIMTPELQKSMDKIAEAMQKIDPTLLQQALTEYKLTEETLNKNLDRTLSLLKKLKMEQQLDQAIRMTEDLMQRQQELTAEAIQQHTDKRDQLADQQNALRQDLDKLENQLDALQKEMADQPAMPQEQVAAAKNDLASSGLDDQMTTIQKEMLQGSIARMQERSDSIQSGLQKAKNQLQQAKDSLTGAMTQRAMRAMQQGMHSFLSLSQMQETLLQQSATMPPTSAHIPEMAERQQQLSSSLDRVINDLYAASKESIGISANIGKTLGQAQQSMQQALQGLEGRDLAQAADRQGQAMARLNASVLQMDAAMQAMIQGGGSGMSMSEFLQQMQKLADGQQGINAQTNGLGDLGSSLSLAQQAAMSRLAQQQGQVRKSLEELAAEAAGLSEQLGSLEHIGDEMREVEKDLAGQRVDRRTKERQNRILSRMLDYQKSMREREHSQQRRAETGKDYVADSPEELPADLGQRRDRLQQDLLRAKQEGYSRDYLELIRKYFESVGQIEDN